MSENWRSWQPEQKKALLTRLQEKNQRNRPGEYAKYARDPAGFCREVLGETLAPDVIALMESCRDNVVTTGRSANSVGKTHGMARLAVWFFLVYDDAQVWTAAAPPESNLKTLLWGEIGSLVEEHRELFAKFNVSLASMQITRNSKSFIRGVTIPATGTDHERETRFSGKHAPHMLFLLDEGNAIPPAVFRGVESCMSGGYNRLVSAFNPRSKSGTVYQMEKDGTANVCVISAMTHPNVLTGKDLIPGAVTRETVLRRINKWTRPFSPGEQRDENSFEVPDFLVGQVGIDEHRRPYPPLPGGWRRVDEMSFWYMVLGLYPPVAANQLIAEAWIENARSRWDLYVAQHGEHPPFATQPVAGLDVGELGVDKSVMTFRYGNYVARQHVWGGVDPLVTTEKAVRLAQGFSARYTNVDSTGVGSSVAPGMRRYGCEAHRVMVANSPTGEVAEEVGDFRNKRDEGLWRLREWLRLDMAMLPPDEDLCQELAAPTYTKDLKGRICVSDSEAISAMLSPRRSPDRLSSLMMTFIPPLEEDEPGEVGIENYA